MTWIDPVVLALLVVVSLWGWRAGALTQLLTIAGFWLGAALGVFLVLAFGHRVSGTARIAFVLAAIVGCAFAFGAVAAWGGRRLAIPPGHSALRRVDQSSGVVVSVVATLVAVWFIGNILAVSTIPSLDGALSGSGLIRTLNRAMPALPDVFARIESFLSSQDLPVVFVNLPPGLVAPAPLPDARSVEAAATLARPSTVKVVGLACGSVKAGSGFVAAPGLVVTNAHVVAGESVTTVVDEAGSHRASVVTFDPGLDLALLRVPGLPDPALRIERESVARGTTGAIAGYPGGATFHAEPAAVNERLHAVGLDIYGAALTTRQVYELNGVVVPGNSGGPVVATGTPAGSTGIPVGTVIGVVFGDSPSAASTGYALTMAPVADEVSRAGTQPVSTEACLP